MALVLSKLVILGGTEVREISKIYGCIRHRHESHHPACFCGQRRHPDPTDVFCAGFTTGEGEAKSL